MSTSVVRSIFLVALTFGPPLSDASADDPPNVLFIAVDDLRPELGCYGVSEIKTPHIDALAAGAVTFDRAYCQQAVCNPSRASLMTGLRPDSTKVWDLVTDFRDTIPDVITLPQHFMRHGYYAVAYGKIYHNPIPDPKSWNEPNHWPEKASTWSAEGRRRLAEYRSQMRADGKSDAAVRRMRAPATEIQDVPDEECPDGEIASQAVEAMRRLAAKDRPFFLATGFIRPHLPFVAPRKYWDLYDPEELILAANDFLPQGSPPLAMNTMYELRDYLDFADTLDPREGPLTEAQQRRLKHGYYASVSFADAQVGRLLAELETLGLADDTIVVLWGDHGWKLGEHRSWCKQSNYEIDARAPLIIRSPSAAGNGKTSSALVEFVDIYPTLCELAGLPLPGHLEGKSLAPLLDQPDGPFKDAAFSQFRRRHEGREYMGYAMRTDRYRYVEWKNRRTGDTFAKELYDHTEDPEENTNIAGLPENRDLIAELGRRMWSALPAPPKFVQKAQKPRRPVAVFANDLDEEVTLFWIDNEDREREQGTIGAGKQLRQNTTLGHRFVVKGANGLRRTFVIGRQTETFVIEEKKDGKLPVEGRPNILFLMGDDWSWPHAGALGDPVVRTPTFDRLAQEGALFENAFVSAPSCTPSRMAIVTGQWHWRLDEAANLGGSLAEDVDVYPAMLQDAGYRIGFSRKGAAPSQHTYRGSDPFGPKFRDFGEFFAGCEDGQPFCFWYGAGEPHRPYAYGTGTKQGLKSEDVEVPACLPDNETVRTDVCDYYERVQQFDADTAKMIGLLEESGQLDNTIVVMTGDNGMPFPRCKATLYDTGTRVPLTIRWGDKIEGGRTVTDFVSLTDLAPTFLEAAGLKSGPEMTGKTLLPILASDKSGRVDQSRDHVLTGMERHVFPNPSRAIRTDDFLYIFNFDPANWPTGRGEGPPPQYDFTKRHWPSGAEAFSYNVDPSPSKQFMLENRDDPELRELCELAFGQRAEEELYDLRKDPGQLDDVASSPEYADDKRRLRDRLEAELFKSEDSRSGRDAPAGAPNVLFISVDDLNDWIGCLGGHPQAKTPNIDRLAASGTLFTNAYCPAASCNPSRTAIMTGISPRTSGLYTNMQAMREILPDAELIPKYFSRNGYHSSGAGKILHYFVDQPSWDEYYTPQGPENPFPPYHYPDERPASLPYEPWMYVEADWAGFDIPDDDFQGDYLVAQWIGKRLAKKHDRPFFLACGIYRPHLPWFVPQKYFDMFPLDEVQLPPGAKEGDVDDLPPGAMRLARGRYHSHIVKHGLWKDGVRAYLAATAYADAMVGRVIDSLAKSPHHDNTIVVLWSDHGWHLGEKERWRKFTGWRVCARVPLIIRVPPGAPGLPAGTVPGSRSTRPVNLVDLYKTLTDLCGLPRKPGIEGHCLIPLLEAPAAPWPHPSITHFGSPDNYAVSTENHRYIHYSDGGEELYHLASDPHEWQNLAADPSQAKVLFDLRGLAPGPLPAAEATTGNR